MFLLLDSLLIVVFAAHLSAVGLATAAPFLCVAVEWRGARRGDREADRVARRLAQHAIWALAAGIVLGLALVALLWAAGMYGWLHGLRTIPQRRLWFGLSELAFYFVCMWLYVAWFERWKGRRWLHRGLALLAGTNVAYHFPLLFSAVAVAATRGDLWGTTLSHGDLMKLTFSPEVLAKALHFWLAATAIGGLWLAVLNSPHQEPSGYKAVCVFGGRVALAATLLQIPSGVYALWAMPRLARERVLGGDLLLSGGMAAGLMIGLVLMYNLLAIALEDCSRRTLARCLVLLAATILLMVGVKFKAQASDNSHSFAKISPRVATLFERTKTFGFESLTSPFG